MGKFYYIYLSVKKDYDNAIADCTQAIRINPNLAVAYNNRGAAYNGKEDYDQGIADLEMALKIAPKFNLAKNNLAAAKKARGKKKR